jgi:hypothetical protein
VVPSGRRVLSTLLAGLLAGCGTAVPRVHVDNGTDIPITIYVNGVQADSLDPGASSDALIAGRAGPPYAIEARTPSGTAIARFAVSSAAYRGVASGAAGTASTMAFPCGRIGFTLGTPPSPLPPDDPAPSAGPCP